MNQFAGESFLNPETLDAIIEMFFEDGPMQVTALQQALQRHDYKTLAEVSHNLLGSTEFLGTSAISSLAAAVESSAKQENSDELLVRVPALVAEVQKLLNELHAAEKESEE